MHSHMRPFTIFSVTALMLALLGGCGSYTLRGKVIEGFGSGVFVVSADDPRLNEPGVEQVRISIHRDPGSLAQSMIATDASGPDGSFAIELPAFGAGWMDERWLVESMRRDYQNASETVRLPSSRQRLLIVVSPGRAVPSQHRDDLWEEYRRYR